MSWHWVEWLEFVPWNTQMIIKYIFLHCYLVTFKTESGFSSDIIVIWIKYEFAVYDFCVLVFSTIFLRASRIIVKILLKKTIHNLKYLLHIFCWFNISEIEIQVNFGWIQLNGSTLYLAHMWFSINTRSAEITCVCNKYSV